MSTAERVIDHVSEISSEIECLCNKMHSKLSCIMECSSPCCETDKCEERTTYPPYFEDLETKLAFIEGNIIAMHDILILNRVAL